MSGDPPPLGAVDPEPAPAPRLERPEVMMHKTKAVNFAGRSTPIVYQDENGSCPLLAICNVLLLGSLTNLNPGAGEVSQQKLLSLVTEHLSAQDTEYPEHHISAVLPRLRTGIDVNPMFTKIDDFEFTPERAIFELLGIPLYHGWIVDPQGTDTASAVGSKSYNALVSGLADFKSGKLAEEDKRVAETADFAAATTAALGVSSPSVSLGKSSHESTLSKPMRRGDQEEWECLQMALRSSNQADKTGESSQCLENEAVDREWGLIDNFLRDTANQLTVYGLFCLHEDVKEGELCVLFRNNHFSTMFKYKGSLYLLVTDQGFFSETDLVWQKLDSVNGAGGFFTSDFTPFEGEILRNDSWNQQQTMTTTADYVAQLYNSTPRNSSGDLDLKLAIALHQHEFEQQYQLPPQQQQPQPSGWPRLVGPGPPILADDTTVLGVMPVYEKGMFKMGGDDVRGIVCNGPQGSSGLVAAYNITAIRFTKEYGDEGPVDEEGVKLFIQQWLEKRIILQIHKQFKVFEPDVDTVRSVIKEHRERLVICPVLKGNMAFKNNGPFWLFSMLGAILMHGWVVDPGEGVVDPGEGLYYKIKECSRDELSALHASLVCQEDRALVQYLLDSADNQLTDYGFELLFEILDKEEFAVVYCYNRFNVVQKHLHWLFILETDEDVRRQFPDVVWRLFDGQVPEDSIYLTENYIPVAEQPNAAKAKKWMGEQFVKNKIKKLKKRPKEKPIVSAESGSIVPASDSEMSTGNISKVDSKKEDGQGVKKQDESKKGSTETSSHKESGITSEKQSKSQRRRLKHAVKVPKEKSIASPEAAFDADQKSEGKVELISAVDIDGVPTYGSKILTGDVTKGKLEKPYSNTLSASAQGKPERQTPKNGDSGGDALKKHVDKEHELRANLKQINPEEYTKMLGKRVAVEVLKPEESKLAPPCGNFQNQGTDYVPAASPMASQGPTVVSDFLDFLTGFKYEGFEKYFEGMVEAFNGPHAPYFFVPYEFIMAHNKGLALKIQNDYPRICEELKESVVQYLKIHGSSYSNVELKIFGIPELKRLVPLQ